MVKEKAISIEEMEKRVFLNNQILEQEKKIAKIKTSGKTASSPKEKAILFWTQKLGYTQKGTFKETKNWISKKDNKKHSKEFEGIVFEKDGIEAKPLWVCGGNILRVWN